MPSRARASRALPTLLGVGALALGCRDDGGSDGYVDRFRALITAERIQVSATTAEARAFLAPRLDDPRLVLVDELAAPEGVPRVVFAGPETPGIEPLLAAAGIAPRDDGFRFDGKLYGFGEPDEPSDAIALTLVDPARARLPLNLAYARSELDAARIVGDARPAARSGFRTWRRGGVERSGALRPDGSPDPERTTELAEARARSLAGFLRVRVGGFTWRVPDVRDRPAWRAWIGEHEVLERLNAARERAGALLANADSDALGEAVVVTLWNELEDKALATGDWGVAWSNPVDHDVHVALVPGAFGEPGTAWAASAARHELGPAACAWLADGFAVDAAGRWCGRALEPWLARLVETLLASRSGLENAAAIAIAGERSPHLVRPLRAALYRELLAARGADHVRACWQGTQRFELDLELAQRFASRLKDVHARHTEGLKLLRRRRGDVLARGTRTGVHVEPDRFAGTEPRRGHGSRGVRRSLVRARELGLGAIAVSAHRYVDDVLPERLGDGHGPRAPVPDEALWRTLTEARELGLATTLRSHALRGPSTTWSTWMSLGGDADWASELERLEQTVEHHALLAELTGCELFCIAGGLRNATDTRVDRPGRSPEDVATCELKLAAWRDIVRVARAAFDGALTYGADNFGELYNVEFWDDLDYVGLDLYEPLGDPDERITRHGLERRFVLALERLAAHGRNVGRPVLVTEIGFPSTTRARLDPTWPSGDPDPEGQAELVRAFARAAGQVRADGARLAGVWWWRWSTDPTAGGGADRGFLVTHKPAEAALSELAHTLR